MSKDKKDKIIDCYDRVLSDSSSSPAEKAGEMQEYIKAHIKQKVTPLQGALDLVQNNEQALRNARISEEGEINQQDVKDIRRSTGKRTDEVKTAINIRAHFIQGMNTGKDDPRNEMEPQDELERRDISAEQAVGFGHRSYQNKKFDRE